MGADSMTKVYPQGWELQEKPAFEEGIPPKPDENNALGAKKGGLTRWQTLASLCKSMVGAGILSLPLAFKQAGLWTGLTLMLIFGFITYQSYKKIVVCSHYLTREYGFDRLDYGWMAQRAFENSLPPFHRFAVPMRHLVNICIFAMQLGMCSVYVVFLKEHAKELIDEKAPDNHISSVVYYLVGFVAISMLVMIRNLKVMALVSMVGNVLMLTALAIIMQYLVRAHHVIGEIPGFTSINGLVLSAGSILYAYEGQAVILPLDNKMKRPKEMLGVAGVLTIGCSLVTIVYTTIGFYGYITFGDDTKASIGLNFGKETEYFIMKILLVTVVYSTYLVQQFVNVDIAWPPIKAAIKSRNLAPHLHLLWEALFKIFLVCLAFGLAIGVPNLDDIIPLVGVTAGMMLSLILPALCHFATFLPEWLRDRKWAEMAFHTTVNATLLVLGIFFFCYGLYTNMKNIISGKDDS